MYLTVKYQQKMYWYILNSLKERVSEEELQTETYKKEELDKFNKKIDFNNFLCYNFFYSKN